MAFQKWAGLRWQLGCLRALARQAWGPAFVSPDSTPGEILSQKKTWTASEEQHSVLFSGLNIHTHTHTHTHTWAHTHNDGQNKGIESFSSSHGDLGISINTSIHYRNNETLFNGVFFYAGAWVKPCPVMDPAQLCEPYCWQGVQLTATSLRSQLECDK